jgi:acetolactate synthase-1/2/3 large subunit
VTERRRHAAQQVEGHGGRLAAEVLRAHGIEIVFTLSGGHLFVLYDGCVQIDLELVDARHEQTATFAAEGWAKVTGRPGCAALTAGPGVTNGISALASARLAGSPMLVIGGRAPQGRWGRGSLQELDHVPIVAPVTKTAATASPGAGIVAALHDALLAARTPHRGPTFVDLPLDGFGPATADIPAFDPRDAGSATPDPDAVARVATLLGAAERPVVVAGGDVYWAGAHEELRALAEAANVPVFANGLGRGLLAADHRLAFSRARSAALRGADLVVVAGTPLDFRLGFGAFGDARVVHLADSPSEIGDHAAPAEGIGADLRMTLAALAAAGVAAGVDPSARAQHQRWVEQLRAEEQRGRDAERPRLESDATPIAPSRVYGELRALLDRDAVVIGDGGDFVSYAGKYIDTFVPGSFLDPGPYGCLGTGPGYALGASRGRPGRQLVLLLGDGALGFSLGDLDTLVRHHVDVTAIVGNNGIWGLEKHPMQALFGYDVVADLRPETRYDLVMEALGGHGELVREPAELRAALTRAFSTPGPSLVNVVTDPTDAYPRSSNLA